MTDRLFQALLRYWRQHRGQSQLELALSAGVSARHLSFLESGRAQPSEAMVLRLMAALDVPLRAQNEALRAAGFSARFAESALEALSPAVNWALERMLKQQEPYPLTLLSVDFRILRSNDAMRRVLGPFIAEPARLPEATDMYALVFDPALARPFVQDWPHLARQMLARLHREVLRSGGDERLTALLTRVLAYPDVDAQWRHPDLGVEVDSALSLRLQRDDLQVGFMTTVTTFSVPRMVTLEELRIESYFPLDAATQTVCERLATETPRA